MGTPDETKGQQLSTRVAFLVAGIGFATLAPLVPTLKARFSLDESALGLLLLCLGIGSLAVMPFGGIFASKFGCRKVIVISALALCLSLPAMVLAPNVPCLALALLLMGAGGGTLDVVMNIQAVIVEEQSGRPMMSGFHGLFSVGSLTGSAGLTAMLSLGLDPKLCQFIITGICVAMLISVIPNLLAFGPPRSDEHKSLALPRGKVLLIGTLCLISFMAEGSVADWSGVLLTGFRHIATAQAGLGYVAFAAMMTLNRLIGDRVVSHLGRHKVVLLGSTIACTGFILTAVVPSWYISILGFGMVGFGLANVVPILFSATGKQSDMPANLALSSASTMGYVGLLVGPPFLGFVAHRSSLIISLALLAGLCAFITLNAKAVTQES